MTDNETVITELIQNQSSMMKTIMHQQELLKKHENAIGLLLREVKTLKDAKEPAKTKIWTP